MNVYHSYLLMQMSHITYLLVTSSASFKLMIFQLLHLHITHLNHSTETSVLLPNLMQMQLAEQGRNTEAPPSGKIPSGSFLLQDSKVCKMMYAYKLSQRIQKHVRAWMMTGRRWGGWSCNVRCALKTGLTKEQQVELSEESL